MKEHDVQNNIRMSLEGAGIGKTFRINVGVGWASNNICTNSDGSKTLYNPRPFATLGSVDETKKLKGFTDVIVIMPTIITPEMVGTKVAAIGFIEVKTLTGKVEPEQLYFIQNMQNLGARAGVARSPEEAIQILKG